MLLSKNRMIKADCLYHPVLTKKHCFDKIASLAWDWVSGSHTAEVLELWMLLLSSALWSQRMYLPVWELSIKILLENYSVSCSSMWEPIGGRLGNLTLIWNGKTPQNTVTECLCFKLCACVAVLTCTQNESYNQKDFSIHALAWGSEQTPAGIMCLSSIK